MLKIDRKSQSFSLLDAPTLADVSITERYDLQEFISNSPDAFFKELGLELFLIGKEIEPSKNVQDRIDLLAVDKEGCCVVVELKRGNHKLHMLQAISEDAKEISFCREFSLDETIRLKLGGHGDMDSKWSYLYEDQWLSIYRGSGSCWARLKLPATSSGATVEKAWVDPAAFAEAGCNSMSEYLAKIFGWILGT